MFHLVVIFKNSLVYQTRVSSHALNKLAWRHDAQYLIAGGVDGATYLYQVRNQALEFKDLTTFSNNLLL